MQHWLLSLNFKVNTRIVIINLAGRINLMNILPKELVMATTISISQNYLDSIALLT